MTTRTPAAKPRRSPRKAAARPVTPPAPSAGSKLDQLAALLARPGGASIAELMSATGWQAHSVRGALAGALKRRGLAIVSEKVDGLRRYRSADVQ